MHKQTAESEAPKVNIPFRILPQPDSRVQRKGWQNYGESGTGGPGTGKG